MHTLNKQTFVKQFNDAHGISGTFDKQGMLIICESLLCSDCTMIGSCVGRFTVIDKEDLIWFSKEYPEHVL